MPRLPSTSAKLTHLRDKSWEISRRLPDVSDVYSASIGLINPKFLTGEYALDTVYIWQESSQMAIGNVLQSVGMPLVQIYKDVVKELNIDIVTEVKDKLIEVYNSLQEAKDAISNAPASANGGRAMSTSVDVGIGFAVEGFSMVPVVGWVVKLAWNVVKFIRGIVDIARADRNKYKTQTIYPDSRFSPFLDNRLLNNMLAELRSTTDWSRMFGPPKLGVGQGTKPDYWVKSMESGAKELYRKDQSIDWDGAGWMGMVPGTTMLHRGVFVKGNKVQDLGPSRLPSMQNVLFWVWKDIIGKAGNAGPAMYTIDTSVLLKWRGYIHGLHKFIYETGEFNGSQKTEIMKMLNKQMGKKVFGWGTKVKPTEGEMDNYQPVKEANALLNRQESFLDSLLVAYIDDDYAAIANNQQLRDKWKGRKRDLLEHPARCDVDLDNVPDRDYRDELKARGAGSPVCKPGATSFAIARIDPFEPGQTQEGQDHGLGLQISASGRGGIGRPRRRGGGGIGYLPLLAAGVGVGTWYAYKKGYINPGKLLK